MSLQQQPAQNSQTAEQFTNIAPGKSMINILNFTNELNIILMYNKTI